MDINEIINQHADKAIMSLKRKQYKVPSWSELAKAYDPLLHPVMTDPNYSDIVKNGKVEKVSKITLDFQRLAVKRMTELIFSVHAK